VIGEIAGVYFATIRTRTISDVQRAPEPPGFAGWVVGRNPARSRYGERAASELHFFKSEFLYARRTISTVAQCTAPLSVSHLASRHVSRNNALLMMRGMGRFAIGSQNDAGSSGAALIRGRNLSASVQTISEDCVCSSAGGGHFGESRRHAAPLVAHGVFTPTWLSVLQRRRINVSY